jgi:hypothetical protein
MDSKRGRRLQRIRLAIDYTEARARMFNGFVAGGTMRGTAVAARRKSRCTYLIRSC